MATCTVLVEDLETGEEYEVVFEYDYYFSPGNYHGLPEDCYPDEEDFSWSILDNGRAPDNLVGEITDDQVWEAAQDDMEDAAGYAEDY